MQFGINTFVWVSPLTTASIEALAPKVKALGFDVLELAIEGTDAIDVAAARAALDAAGLGSIVLTAPNPAGSTGTVDVAVNLGIGTSDQSCLATHPVMAAPANSLAWLRGKNGPCVASNTYTADPSARASFGVFPAEQRKAVHIRELY